MNFFKESHDLETVMLDEIDKPGSDIENYVKKMEGILMEKKNAI